MKKSERSFAFFDVDETIISLKSMFSFRRYYFLSYKARQSVIYPIRYRLYKIENKYFLLFKKEREHINRKFYEKFKGELVTDVEKAANEWFEYINDTIENLYVDTAISALKAHQQMGREVVFVSGSSLEILRPLAEKLQVKYILATRLESVDGRYSGKIIPPQTIGKGKQEIIQAFLQEHQCNGADCFAYGDHWSDIPMLEVVGHPHIITADKSLEAYAKSRSWTVLQAKTT